MITPTTNSTTNELLSEQHYYPFGMAMNGPWVQAGEGGDLYRYNGKELNEELGLYDYGARWYDPAIARWTSVDPLASSYAPASPYNYVLNNPINTIDPDGMRVLAVNEETQDYILVYLNEQLGEGHGFSFNKKGVLRHRKKDVADDKKYSDDQQSIFDGIMEITKDRYTDLYVAVSEDENVNVEVESGNGFTFKQGQIGKDINGDYQAGEMLEIGLPLGGKRNGVIMVNRKQASILQSSAQGGGSTEACESCVFIHEALDHGLYLSRTGSGTPPNPSINPNIARKREVLYENKALKVKGGANAKIRDGKDHGIK